MVVTEERLFIMYKIWSGQGSVVGNEGVVIQDADYQKGSTVCISM